MRPSYALGAAVLASLGAGCTRSHDPPPAPAGAPREVVLLEGETMGGTWHVRLAAARARRAEARAMQSPIQHTLDRVDRAMSTWRKDSEVSRFNAHASTAPFPVSEETALVVERALEIGRITEGAFDITIDPLIVLWGFDRGGPRDTIPTPAEIEEARRHVGLERLRLERGPGGSALVKSDPNAAINLGGIASGYAVDAVVELLARRGFDDVMVEVTGEVRVLGRSASGAPWRIGVQAPELEPGVALLHVVLEGAAGAALTTSGTYHSFFEVDGRRYSHILDPTTGAPLPQPRRDDTGAESLVSVTVFAPDALTADAYDTALLLLGEERARRVVARHAGLEALFIHQRGDGSLRVTHTAGFPRLEEGGGSLRGTGGRGDAPDDG
jgi:FAD:protein FMN transferase